MDARFLMYAVWALATLLVWAGVVRDDWRAYKGDRRNVNAELISDIALLIAAVAAAATLIVLVVGQDIPGLRGFMLAVFLGGFLGAGAVKLTLRRRFARGQAAPQDPPR